MEKSGPVIQPLLPELLGRLCLAKANNCLALTDDSTGRRDCTAWQVISGKVFGAESVVSKLEESTRSMKEHAEHLFSRKILAIVGSLLGSMVPIDGVILGLQEQLTNWGLKMSRIRRPTRDKPALTTTQQVEFERPGAGCPSPSVGTDPTRLSAVRGTLCDFL